MHEARALRTPWRAVTLFLLPALTLYVAFTAYPVVKTLWNSLHIVLPNKHEFIGLANFVEVQPGSSAPANSSPWRRR